MLHLSSHILWASFSFLIFRILFFSKKDIIQNKVSRNKKQYLVKNLDRSGLDFSFLKNKHIPATISGLFVIIWLLISKGSPIISSEINQQWWKDCWNNRVFYLALFLMGIPAWLLKQPEKNWCTVMELILKQ